MSGSSDGARQSVRMLCIQWEERRREAMHEREKESKQEKRMARTRAYLLRCERPLGLIPKLLDDLRVASKILLAADEDNRKAGAEVTYF
jgi:hypothetical protein